MNLGVLAATMALLLAACATPYGDPSPLGGAVETPVSEDTFSIATRINGYSPPGLLKPLLLRRARELGKARGYDSFLIESVNMGYFVAGLSYDAQAVIRFSKQRLIPTPGVVYAVNAPDSYRPSLDASDAVRLAKLKGSARRDEKGWSLSLTPVFLDAVAATSYGRDATTFLNPGAQRFFVHFWFSPTYWGGLGTVRQGFVLVQRNLEAHNNYVMVGTYKDDVIELWLEASETKARIGPSELVSLKTSR